MATDVFCWVIAVMLWVVGRYEFHLADVQWQVIIIYTWIAAVLQFSVG